VPNEKQKVIGLDGNNLDSVNKVGVCGGSDGLIAGKSTPAGSALTGNFVTVAYPRRRLH
jgi:hypothetical protein